MLVVAGTINLDPSQRTAAEAAFDRMRAATLAEPGCMSYEAYLDRTDPGTIFIFERWKSQADLDAHFATAHMAEFGAALAGFGVSGMDVKKYVVSSEGPVP
jgi:quinol monooxygenase YgiN